MTLALIWIISIASADRPCAVAADWARRCSNEEVVVQVRLCNREALVLTATGASGTAHAIEIRAPSQAVFRIVGGVGFAPIGEFQKWSEAPEDLQRGLAQLEACAANDPTLAATLDRRTDLPAPRRGQIRHRGHQREDSSPVPWLLLIAMILGATITAKKIRSTPPARIAWTGGALLLLSVVTFIVRQWLLPVGFFHQNGQGPIWVAFSICPPCSYGPGFRELFGWLHGTIEPSTLVFTIHALLGAIAPALVFLLARQLGASRIIGGSLAVVVAADPVFGRIVQSESYFATGAIFVLIASALLAAGTSEKKWRWSLLAFVAAGLVVSQAARIHPVLWPPLALTPLAALLGTGSLRHRLWRTGVATAMIAGTVLITSGGVLTDVLTGDLGQRWSYMASLSPPINMAVLSLAVVGVPIIWLGNNRRNAIIQAIALLAVSYIMAISFSVPVYPHIAAAHLRLFVAPLVCAFAAILWNLVRTRWHQGIVTAFALLGATLLIIVSPSRTPTDAREQAWVLEWADELGTSELFFVGRREKWVLSLPLYGRCLSGEPVTVDIQDGVLPERAVYYYRSSLCSSEIGAAQCQAIEENNDLTPIHTITLPAIPSMMGNEYATTQVEVGLFRVERHQ